MRSIILSAAAPFLIAACLALASADQTGRRPASPPVGDAPTDDLFRPPDAPLDPRIDADRITEHHTVPLRPPRLRMPLPVSHRIAT